MDNDKKVVCICVGYFISQIALQAYRYKKNKDELEKITRLNKMTENIGERLSESIRESSEKANEDAQKLWDETFDYAVDVYDLHMRRISLDIFSTRKEAEEYRDKLKIQYGKGYVVSIGIVSKGKTTKEE